MLLALIERDADGLAQTSAELLTFARQHDVDISAVVLGVEQTIPVGLGAHGVQNLYTVDIDEYSPEAHGSAVAQLIGELSPTAVLAAGHERGNEIMAQAAARSGLPLATNCVSVTGGDTWNLTRIRAAGMLLEDAELDASIKMATLAPGTVEPSYASQPIDDVTVNTFTPKLDGVACSRLAERTSRAKGISLANARVVVSGGRGVGSAEGFAPLEELAQLLHGAVGCSRVATNNGWRPHSDQVGQTGTKVNPQLYLACGISGATQHWVGCMDAKNILAINTDAEAPMVTRASYAVIGDVQEVLSAVIAEVHRRREGVTPGG